MRKIACINKRRRKKIKTLRIGINKMETLVQKERDAGYNDLDINQSIPVHAAPSSACPLSRRLTAKAFAKLVTGSTCQGR